MSEWLTVKNEATMPAAEVRISGQIGASFWDDTGTSEQQFLAALDGIPAGRKITLLINSEGGSIKDGLGIFNAIRRRSADVTAVITGYALSIASYIPLAASKVVSPKGSVWMIHKPWTGQQGNANDMRKAAEMLDKHEDAMVAEYVAATGQSEERIRKDLDSETWMTGEEAVAYGLADELSDDAVALAALGNQSRFRRVPVALGGNTPPPTRNNNKDNTMTEPTTAEATAPASPTTSPPAAAAQDYTALAAKLLVVQQQLERERTTRITKAVDQAVIDGRITIASAANWTKRCLQDETVLDDIQALEPRSVGAPNAGSKRIVAGHACALDAIKALKRGEERQRYMIENWSDLRDAEARGQFRLPQMANTNTDSATLLGTMLTEGSVTVLQTVLGPLRAFTTDVGIEGMVPRRPVIVRTVTAGGTAQASATSFEDTTNFVGTVAEVTVTPIQLTSGGHLTNAEINNGNKMAQWSAIKAAEIGQKVMAAVAAIITTGNFTGTPLTAAASAFSGADLNTLWGQLSKAPTKGAILSSTYVAKLLPTTMESINGLAGWPGWSGIYINDYWTGATANTTGFVCHPQAIACAIGAPVTADSAGRAGLSSTNLQIPGLDATVQVNSWFSLSSRTDWMTLDVVFGAAKLDGSAGLLIKSA